MASYITESVVGGGTVDAITLTNTVTVAEAGECTFRVKVPGANTSTTPTLQPSGWTTPRTIVKFNNVALAAGDLVGWHVFTYDSVLDKFVVGNPYAAGGGGTGTGVAFDQFLLMGA